MNTQQSEGWVERFARYKKEQEIPSDPEPYIHVGLNAACQYWDLIGDIRKLRAEAVEEGRNMAVDYIEEHYSAKAPKSTAIQDFNELTEVLEAARTISSE